MRLNTGVRRSEQGWEREQTTDEWSRGNRRESTEREGGGGRRTFQRSLKGRGPLLLLCSPLAVEVDSHLAYEAADAEPGGGAVVGFTARRSQRFTRCIDDDEGGHSRGCRVVVLLPQLLLLRLAAQANVKMRDSGKQLHHRKKHSVRLAIGACSREGGGQDRAG